LNSHIAKSKQASPAAEKVPQPLCHSERSEESLLVSFLILKSKKDSSLRSEWQIKAFFPQPLKPALLKKQLPP
jgi:hypothetical protein